jgi:hypothetical protein
MYSITYHLIFYKCILHKTLSISYVRIGNAKRETHLVILTVFNVFYFLYLSYFFYYCPFILY